MAAINAYIKSNGLTKKCKRFSEYTRGQLRELFEYAGYDDTPILFTETDYGLEIRFYEANVIYLDVLQEINRLLSDLDDCIIRFDNGDVIVECYYDEKYIELLDEDEFVNVSPDDEMEELRPEFIKEMREIEKKDKITPHKLNDYFEEHIPYENEQDNKYVNMLEDICEKCSHYDGSYCDYYKQNLYKGVSCSHFEKRNNHVS